MIGKQQNIPARQEEQIASSAESHKRENGRRRNRKTSDSTADVARMELPQPEYLSLGDAEEDVVSEATRDENEVKEQPQVVPQATTETAVVSQPSNKVYIQESAGFRKALRQKYETMLAERQKISGTGEPDDGQLEVPAGAEAIRTGIASQNVFRTLAVTLQGLLAGFTIAHCLTVVFSSPSYFTSAHFISHYAPLALPAHCLYYVVLVICTVATLDRYDIGQSFVRVVLRALTFQSGGLAVIFYLAATVMNQISINMEERMTLHYRNVTLDSTQMRYLETHENWMDDDVQQWKGLLIAKAVLVTVAWIIIAVRPGTDLLTKHLRQADAEFAQNISSSPATPVPQIAAVTGTAINT